MSTRLSSGAAVFVLPHRGRGGGQHQDQALLFLTEMNDEVRSLEPFVFGHLMLIVFLFSYSPSIYAAVTCKCEDKARIECFSTFQECSDSCGGKAAVAKIGCGEGWLPAVYVQAVKLKAGISVNRISQSTSLYNPYCSISACSNFCVLPPTSTAWRKKESLLWQTVLGYHASLRSAHVA